MRYQLAAGEPRPSPGLEADPEGAFRALVGQSPGFLDAVETAARVAARPASTALLVGEAGTGKELFARSIHAASPVAETSAPEAPFVPIDCSSLPSRLLETELFGEEGGTFGEARRGRQGLLELARTGTLFLEEVGELSQDLQPRLLKALDERTFRRVGGFGEKEVRCRVIAATRQPLETSVATGRFRDDLFDRLNVLRVAVPPLRERDGDIPLLARHFLQELAESGGLRPARLSPEAVRVLEGHSWPGNVRELKNVLDRAALACDGETILPRHLSISRRTELQIGDDAEAVGFIALPSEGRSLSSVEGEAIRLTLRLTRWNRSAAARILGISRPTLARKIELHGLTPDEPPRGER